MDLLEKGSARIDGFGDFRSAVSEDGNATVEFTPTASVAEVVNAPFEMFVAEPLNNEVTPEILDEAAPHLPDVPLPTESESESAELDDTSSSITDNGPENVSSEPSSQPDVAEGEPAQASEVTDRATPVEAKTEAVASEAQPTAAPRTAEQLPAEEMVSHQPTVEPTPDPAPAPVVPPTPAVDNYSTEEIEIDHTPFVPDLPEAATPASEPSATLKSDRSTDEDEAAVPSGPGSMLMFGIGLIVGLAVGAVATFFYMAEATAPTNAEIEMAEDSATDVNETIIE